MPRRLAMTGTVEDGVKKDFVPRDYSRDNFKPAEPKVTLETTLQYSTGQYVPKIS